MSNPTKLGRLEKLSVNILTDTSKMLKDAKTELFADLGGRVLEVGAGTGVNVYFFKEKRVTEWVAVEPDLKLADVKANRSGLPDLIQLNPPAGGYRLIEVKGPGDRLQDNQVRWLEYCVANEIPVAVCYVSWEYP